MSNSCFQTNILTQNTTSNRKQWNDKVILLLLCMFSGLCLCSLLLFSKYANYFCLSCHPLLNLHRPFVSICFLFHSFFQTTSFVFLLFFLFWALVSLVFLFDNFVRKAFWLQSTQIKWNPGYRNVISHFESQNPPKIFLKIFTCRCHVFAQPVFSFLLIALFQLYNSTASGNELQNKGISFLYD